MKGEAARLRGGSRRRPGHSLRCLGGDFRVDFHLGCCQAPGSAPSAPKPLWVRWWLSHGQKPGGARAWLCGLFWAQALPLGFF